MKRLIPFFFLLSAVANAGGPILGHKDRFVQQEFENVYHDIQNAGTPDPLTLSSATITNLTTSAGTATNHAATFDQIKYLTTPAQTVATANFSTTSNSYQATNLSASITPSSASSRVKISASGTITSGTTAASGACLVTLYRGTTNLAVGGNTAFYIQEGETGKSERGMLGLTFIDSPATTSATTYAVRIKNNDSTVTCTFGSDQPIILEEIR